MENPTPPKNRPNHHPRNRSAARGGYRSGRCEVLRNTRIEYSCLVTIPTLVKNCEVADAAIGKFTAIANSVRIGAPNHPMDRPVAASLYLCPEYYDAPHRRS